MTLEELAKMIMAAALGLPIQMRYVNGGYWVDKTDFTEWSLSWEYRVKPSEEEKK